MIKFTCQCGLRLIVPVDAFPITCLCGYVTQRQSKLKQVGDYIIAVAYWVKSGRVKRGTKEVNKIYNTFCKPCRYFNGKSCKICGCKVNKSRKAMFNKIRMATEHCPIGKW